MSCEKCFKISSRTRMTETISRNVAAHDRVTLLTEKHVPVDTGRKLNIHKTFRRRSGRLLNVLCTFNLRLVSTGITEKTIERLLLK